MGRNKGYGRQVKPEKPDIRKMMKYTAKKIIWVTNYSLSFSKKDSRKEILIKLLGCIVILQSVSLILSFVLKAIRTVSFNPFFSFCFLILTGAFVFKKEFKSFCKSEKSESKKK